jgi:DNA-binding winged helix-turn-helix (wHTH) protein/TolB-like protein
MPTGPRHFYEFGPFQIDVIERRLLRDGEPQHLTPKVFDILLKLAENNGHVLSKDELLQAVWPDTVVEENNLTQNISVLRKVLGDGPYIETVPRCGYRFAVPVMRRWAASQEAASGEAGSCPAPVAEGSPASQLVASQAAEGSRTTAGAPSASGFLGLRRALSSLRWVLVGAVALGWLVLALMESGLSGSIHRNLTATPPRHRPILAPYSGKSVAVLPFQVLGSSPSLAYAAYGLRGAVASRLLRIKGFHVLPFDSLEPSGKSIAAEELARRSGASLEVDGVVQGTPDAMRVAIRVQDVENNRPLWASVYSGNSADLPGIEDEIDAGLEAALAMPRDTNSPEPAETALLRNRAREARRTATVKMVPHIQDTHPVATTAEIENRPDGAAPSLEAAATSVGESGAPAESGGHWRWVRNRLKSATGWIPHVFRKLRGSKQATSSAATQ